MGRIRPIGLIVLALLTGGASYAQEFRTEYYLDDQTEMTLDPHPTDPKAWNMELRQFGDATESVVFSISGELKPLSKDLYEYRSDPGRNPKNVRLVGHPGERDGKLEMTTRNLVYGDGKPAHIHGTFRYVEPEYLEARTKERYKAADAALRDIVNKLAAELGQSAEPKLREAQADRIKWRDQLALQAVGGPNQPKVGIGYWQTLFQATLDTIAFFRSYTGRTATKTVAGSYYAANGASLTLDTPPEGGLHFTVAVSLAPIAFLPSGDPRPESDPPLTGQITGVARLFGGKATFKGPATKTATGETREPAELVFSIHGHIVHIDAKNTEAYAGPDLFFSGDYYKAVPPPPRK